jgi:ubiquinone/menaquinone biosynthesis C-methylase UbiE
MGLRSSLAKALDGMGRLARGTRLRIVQRNTEADLGRPNSPDEWAAIYQKSPAAIGNSQSPIARAILELTEPGEILLEAGCGHALLSAELASAGRMIELCDFSQSILDRAVTMFERSQLPPPRVRLADLTAPLPWADGAVDVVWSSGVLEHWTDEELAPILQEMVRISRKAVIALVPNARSVFYRMGKHLMEEARLWPYGRELPRASLAPLFRAAGLEGIREFTIMPEDGPEFLRATDPGFYAVAAKWLTQLPPDDPVLQNQGYLLLTAGFKPGTTPVK